MLPNLLIVGAQKCGTSSLHRYLSLHPDVSMSDPKELDFFIKPDDTVFPAGNWPRGVDWYRSHFAEPSAVRGEASPNYTAYPLARGVPERAAELLGEARIIYMVRDPIDRIVSHYIHRRATGAESRPLDKVIDESLASERDAPAAGLLCRSMYYMQLERWLRSFPERDLLVVAQEDLLHRRLETIATVFRFLGVDDAFASPGFEATEQVSDAKRPPTRLEGWLRRRRPGRAPWAAPATPRTRATRAVRALTSRKVDRPLVAQRHRERLEGRFADDVSQLRTFTGQSFPGWSV